MKSRIEIYTWLVRRTPRTAKKTQPEDAPLGKTNKTMKWLGLCSNLRSDSAGEGNWRSMMEHREPVSMNCLLRLIGSEELYVRLGLPLDDMNAQDGSAGAYVSFWGEDFCAFYQNAGFEYIWVANTNKPPTLTK